MLSTDLVTRIIANGKPIKTYYGEDGKKWVEARENTAYTIEVKNNSNAKVLAIISVDGINVINGQAAELKAENGYVINPYSKMDVEGWRISNTSVKEFLFTFNKADSYSVKLGAGEQNLGVIGIAFYRSQELERDKWATIVNEIHNHYHDDWHRKDWWPYYPYDPFRRIIYTVTCNSGDNIAKGATFETNSLGSTNTAYSADVVQKTSFQAGTAKGEEVDSKVTEVDFPATILVCQETIYYDSLDNLKKRGIIKEGGDTMPQPFKNTSYCPDV